jgi:hypothetical protein
VYERECHPDSIIKQLLVGLFIEFQENYKKEDKISCFRTEALLKLLLADCLDMADGHKKASFEKRRRRESYNKIIIYVENNFQLPIDANRVSESLALSAQYINCMKTIANMFETLFVKICWRNPPKTPSIRHTS